MTIEVYAFEDAEGQSVTDWTTMDPKEAQAYAQEQRCRLIARIFAFSDSELVDDYTNGNCEKCGEALDDDYIQDDEGTFCQECFQEVYAERSSLEVSTT